MTNPARILIVDDNEANRTVLNDLVIALGHISVLAENGLSALGQMEKQPADLVLLDILMPEMDGYEVLNRIKGDNDLRYIPVIMISAVDEIESVVQCIEKGADDYLTKPFNPTLLKARIGACLEKKRLQDVERELLENTLKGSIDVLTEILAYVNPTAFSQASRLKRYARHIAKECNLSETWQFELAAMLSQIGCITLSLDTLQKVCAGQELSKEEQGLFAAHPSFGRDMMAKIPRLEKVSNMIAMQQKPFVDYGRTEEPYKRDPVALGGQILKVAISYDLLILTGMSHKKALAQMQNYPDENDPALVAALNNFHDIPVKMTVRITMLDKLYSGVILDEDIYVDGVLLAAKELEVTLSVLIRLRRFAHMRETAIPVRIRVPLW
ncbi:MAG: response regulator [Candidatus Brocadiales bacterium]